LASCTRGSRCWGSGFGLIDQWRITSRTATPIPNTVATAKNTLSTVPLAPRTKPRIGRIEEALVRHREGRHGDQALERLLGLEMKREQYELGAAFCSKVVELTDEATLVRIWDSPEALPSMPELEEPSLWLARSA